MTFMVKDSGGGDFEVAPEGNHIARCWLVCDLGVQLVQGQFGGLKHQMQLGWELCDENMKDGRPFSVFSRYTVSLHEKSKLRPMLESWRGKKFTADELKGFDVEKLAGVACMLNVTHNVSGDRTYANIAAVTPLPRGMKAPAVRNELIVFSTADEWKLPGLPDWLVKRINMPDPKTVARTQDTDGGNDPNGNDDMGGAFSPVDDDEFSDVPF